MRDSEPCAATGCGSSS